MANIPAANLGGITDPRASLDADAIGSKESELNYTHAPAHGGAPDKLHDRSVTFEEYHYYALREREYERGIAPASTIATGIANVIVPKRFKKGEREQEMARRTSSVPAISNSHDNKSPAAFGRFDGVVSDEEWHTAARAARTATWGAVFYLITTDILGPFSVPWAFAQLGYGPGVSLYTIFAFFAGVSGFLLWKQFLGLDSSRYPVVGYGDIAFRIYGRWARHVVNVLQSIQFFLNVALLIVSSAQSLSQLAQGSDGTGFLCYVVAQVVFTIAGFLLGQIRTLQRFSWLANIAIWLNVFIIFMVMGVTSNSSPNWEAAHASDNTISADGEPIVHTGGSPPGKDLTDNVNGLMQAVFSYGGATLFTNLMAEMRRPYDFWKGMIMADVFIFLCYLIFGVVVYAAQGQAAVNPAYLGVNPYSWQTVGNVFALITALIAAVLYGNIGIKVLYANVGREFLRFPALESRVGKWIWVGFVPLYWILAFIVAAAVPQVSYLGAFVGAAFILQFSYTFPPILMIGYNVLKDSMPADGGFDPSTGRVAHEPITFGRIWRGFRVRIFENSFNMIYFLGAATTGILGIYASIVGMIEFYANTQVTAFSCNSPS